MCARSLRERLLVDLVDPKIAEDRADVRPNARVVDLASRT
jgi:hypothetical protein